MVRFRLIGRLLRRFAQINNRRRALILEATLGLAAARLAVKFVSFPHLSRRFGSLVPSTDPRVSQAAADASPYQLRIAKEVSWAVTRAARYVPFNALCLSQAMAAHRMLRRRGIASVIHFGAGKGQTNPLDAHAWLNAAGVEVTGYPVADRLAEIGCFV